MSPSEEQQSERARLQRLQTGAAVILGVALLLLIVLRAIHGRMLPAGWWRP